MKTLKTTFLFAVLFFVIGCHPNIPEKLLYIDEDKPSIHPKLFAKGFISKDTIAEFGSVFNREGTEFFFATEKAGMAWINYTTIKDSKWTEPIIIISHDVYSFNDPMLSPDGNKLYFISDMPKSKLDTLKDYDIWYLERQGDAWSAPINAGNSINSEANEYYISFTHDGSMYYSSNSENYKVRSRDFDIYKSPYKDGAFLTPEKISETINTKMYEADVFIAPDESYIIFCSIKRAGYGSGDLYISFKNENGDWTKAVNMGEEINTERHELCPYVTADGRYFFYTSNQDIYWVSTEFIQLLKEKNKQ